jgi:hypothetical protein
MDRTIVFKIMAKYQVIKDNKVLKEFDEPMNAAIFATNNEYGPGMSIVTDDKKASETWTHFEYKEKL